MTVKEMAAACGWTLLAGGEGENNQVDGCYIGDLLSWVMARAQSGNVWITVMGNVNAIAVATRTANRKLSAFGDVSCIVLTENATLDEEAAKKAELQEIPVYSCEANSYQTAVKVYELLK